MESGPIASDTLILYQSIDSDMRRNSGALNGEVSTAPAEKVSAVSSCRSGLPPASAKTCDVPS